MQDHYLLSGNDMIYDMIYDIYSSLPLLHIYEISTYKQTTFTFSFHI